jgi:hypothetical protein
MEAFIRPKAKEDEKISKFAASLNKQIVVEEKN